MSRESSRSHRETVVNHRAKSSPVQVIEETLHPIQVVARRTGLSADVIRAWERRHNAVSPQRSKTSRRLYSDADVVRLRLLKEATHAGRRIGDVAALSVAELEALINADEAALPPQPVAPDSAVGPEPLSERAREASGHIDACLDAIKRLDPLALEAALSDASVTLSTPALLEEVIHPVLVEVGEQWRVGTMRLCHEHMATSAIRSLLGSMILSGTMISRSAPILLVTTPAQQRHDLGAMMVAVVAATSGWLPLYLGASTPTEDIAFAAIEKQVRAVALSLCYPGDDPNLPNQLLKLRRQLPESVALIVGGKAAGSYRSVLDEIGARQPASLVLLMQELDSLRD